jgi:predicted RNA-binding Zn ribbon-like protein
MDHAEFALVGEPLVLDLINTRPTTPSGPADLLASPAGLAAWLAVQAERLAARGVTVDGQDDQSGVRVSTEELAAVHAIREHAARALDRARQGRHPAAADLQALNRAMRAAPAYQELQPTTGPTHDPGDAGAPAGGDHVIATLRRDGPLSARLAAVLAEAAAELLADPAVTSVRVCAAQDCTLLFLPGHPNRRWCSAARCGNRTRVARYYQRHGSPASRT